MSYEQADAFLLSIRDKIALCTCCQEFSSSRQQPNRPQRVHQGDVVLGLDSGELGRVEVPDLALKAAQGSML
jgi:hypothetical protein